jgi:chromosome partitioning protein
MQVGSGPGLGWPEESHATGRARPAEAAGRPPVGPVNGLGWPAVTANGSPDRPASAAKTSPAEDESWAEYVARPAAGTWSAIEGEQPAVTADGPAGVYGAAEGRDDQAQGAAEGGGEPDEPERDWQPAPERVRQALAGVSRETVAAEPASPGPGGAAAHSQAAPEGHRPTPGEGAPNPAAGVQAAASPDSVGGAEDPSSGESEVQVAIPAVPDAVADTPIARAAQAAVVARSGGAPWPRPSSCRIITIANQKGGVGKTTTAVNMAASLAMHGARVLVVDLDPQGNASTALDVDHHSGIPSVYNVLVDGQPLGSVIKQVSGFPQLYCAPAAIDLAGAEIELVPLVARESRLARALTAYDASNLDYIFIDCPPSLGLLTVNALVAAPEVLIPIQCEYYALEGLEQLLRTVDLVRSHLNPILSVTTILLTMYDGRTRLASQVADEVREHFGAVVLSSVIPRSVRVSEAPSYGQSVMTYDPGSTGALAYLEAARELAQRNAAPAAG